MSTPAWCSDATGGARLSVIVQPRASREAIGPAMGDRMKVAVHAPPADDRANDAVVRLVAGTLGIAPSRVSVIAGRTSRRKTLRIEGVAAAAVADRLLPSG